MRDKFITEVDRENANWLPTAVFKGHILAWEMLNSQARACNARVHTHASIFTWHIAHNPPRSKLQGQGMFQIRQPAGLQLVAPNE